MEMLGNKGDPHGWLRAHRISVDPVRRQRFYGRCPVCCWYLQPMDESGPVSLLYDAIYPSARRITFFDAGVPGVVG